MKTFFLLVGVGLSMALILGHLYLPSNKVGKNIVVSTEQADPVLSPVPEVMIVESSMKPSKEIAQGSNASSSVEQKTQNTLSVSVIATTSAQAAPVLYEVDPGFGGGIPPKRVVSEVEGLGLKFCDEL